MTVMAAPRADLSLPGEVTDTGYVLPEELTFEEWQRVGGTLRQLGKSVMWWIGDWLRFGERKYGETYTQAIEATGYDAKTLRNAVHVARAVEMSRRRDNLSWSHHEAVAALEPAEQDVWLSEAEREHWTRDTLRRGVRKHAGAEPADDPDPLDDPADEIAGADEHGAPLGWVEAETSEHLYPVEFRDGRLFFKIPNPVTRQRGDKPDQPRESILSDAVKRPITLTWSVAVREAGLAGLMQVANEIRSAIYNDPIIRRDWLKIPQHGSRSE